MGKQVKNQHYVPKMYIKRFSPNGKKICVESLIRMHRFSLKICPLAMKSYYLSEVCLRRAHIYYSGEYKDSFQFLFSMIQY